MRSRNHHEGSLGYAEYFGFSLFGTKIIVVRQLYAQPFNGFLLLGESAALFFVYAAQILTP